MEPYEDWVKPTFPECLELFSGQPEAQRHQMAHLMMMSMQRMDKREAYDMMQRLKAAGTAAGEENASEEEDASDWTGPTTARDMIAQKTATCWADGCRCKKGQDTKKLSRCASCGVAFYCSSQHQRADWPRHKRCCKVLKKATDPVEVERIVAEHYLEPLDEAMSAMNLSESRRRVDLEPSSSQARRRRKRAAPPPPPVVEDAVAKPSADLTLSERMANFHAALAAERDFLAGL